MTTLPQRSAKKPRTLRASDPLASCLDVVAAEAPSSALWMTLRASPQASMAELLQRFTLAIKEHEATLVHTTLFGAVPAAIAATEYLRQAFGSIDWSVTCVEGAGTRRDAFAGIAAFALTGASVERIRAGHRVVASTFEDDGFRHCVLGGILPKDLHRSPPDQTQQTLYFMGEVLSQAGFAFADVVRTWFFLDDILSWYPGFNLARKEFYADLKFSSGSHPASTGIGAGNPAGAALVAGAWAVQPVSDGARASCVPSPLQGPAPAYGSLFSRALELVSPAGRRLFISGTASIAPDGQTLWQEDIRRQVAQTMDVVREILRSRDMDFRDLAQAAVYFKRAEDANALAEWARARGVKFMPAVSSQCDICRPDLLFELEAEAWLPNDRKQHPDHNAP